MALEFDDPHLSVIANAAHAQSCLLESRPVLRVQPVPAEVVLDHFVAAIERRRAGTCADDDALRLPGQRTGERRDDERLGIGARLGVLRRGQPQDVACVLDQYVLEAASGADEWNAALPSHANGAQHAVHALVGAGRSDPEAGVSRREQVGRGHGVGGNPLPCRASVRERRVERGVRLVAWIVVADDTDQHLRTVAHGPQSLTRSRRR